jgi:hypothetical protein
MSSLNEEFIDDIELLTKPKQKKPRTEAQIAATERMREALGRKTEPVATDKKIILKAIKEKLNGPSKNAPIEEESEEEKQEEVAPPPPPKKVPKKVPAPKKEPKIIYESPSESEEEVIIVKKKKKNKKKTIIYEESESEEEEAPKPKSRETKTQQNKSSGFKVHNEAPKAPAPLYYFA